MNLIKSYLNRILTHHGLKKYGANISWLFLEKFVRLIVGFSVGIYVARQLGPVNYGILNYALSYVGIFAIVAGLGLDSIVVRELVRAPEETDKLMGTAFILKIIGFLIMLVAVLIGLIFTNNDLSTNIITLVITAGYLFQTLQVIDFYFQAKVKSKYIAIPQITALLLASCFRVYYAWKGYPVIYFAGVESGYMALSAILYLYFYLATGANPWKWTFSYSHATFIFKNSWPLFLSGIAAIVTMRIDRVMIKEMMNLDAVGNYSVAGRLVEIWYIIPGIIGQAMFPSIINAKKISREHYLHRLNLMTLVMLWSGIIVALLMTLTATPIVSLLYGEMYNKAAGVIMIYSWCIPFVWFSPVSTYWLVNELHTKYALIFSVSAALLNVILNIYLIRKYGINGAAIASLISFFSGVLQMGIYPKTRTLFKLFMTGLSLKYLLRWGRICQNMH